jgi:hypothetical protein
MTGTEKRIKELYDKMTRSGITRDERVELAALEARAEVAKLQQVEVDKDNARLQHEKAEIARLRAETAQMLAEADREAGYLQILRTEYSGKLLRDSEANRQEVFSLWDELQGLDRSLLGTDASFGAEWFAAVMKANPKLANRFAWTTRPDPNARKLQEEMDRKTFSVVCRSHDVSEIEANFKLLVDVLGSGFSEYAAAQAIRSNAVSLSPATAEELTKWHEEQVEQRNFDLMYRTDIPALRKMVREEAEQRRVATAQADADRILKEKEQIEAGQFEALPATTNDGKQIDKQFFLKCDRQTMKYYIQRYGDAAVTKRIRGIR